MWQAEHIKARLLSLYPKLEISIRGFTTTGDRILDTPLAKIGGKGLFIKELEQALEARQADIAVHSMKDVPMEVPPQFCIAAITTREDARDAFVSNRYRSLAELPAGSVVGTSSLRRQSQLKARYPQLEVAALRGNVQTRLRKLDEGVYSAIILAAAGLSRLGLGERIAGFLSTDDSLPAVGQGALGIETRVDDHELQSLLAPLNDAETSACVNAERAVSRGLGGSCQVPIGAFGVWDGDEMFLRGLVASPDGLRLVADAVRGDPRDAEDLGKQLADRLIAQGADEILAALA